MASNEKNGPRNEAIDKAAQQIREFGEAYQALIDKVCEGCTLLACPGRGICVRLRA